jgi:glycosyltransferase involved in cell wall biosynthesis
MNICLLPSTFLPLVGGLEIVVSNLATALKNQGHNVYVVTPYPKFRKVAESYSYNMVRFGFRGCGRLNLTTATATLTLLHITKRYKIDVINVHNVYRSGSWAYFFSRFNKRIPIIGTPHGDDVQITPEIQDGVRLDPAADKIVRRNLSKFTRITAISNSLRNDLHDLVEKKDNIVDVPNGVWVKSFQRNVDSTVIKTKFGIPLDSTAIISIGRNHPRKGFTYGLEAIAKLKKSGHNISFILVGRYMEPIIERAKALSISDCIITPGQVNAESVSDLLQSSDIYLSPSIVESFGVATLEAMSAGLPCVVTDIAGSRDIVSSEYGFLVQPKDSDQICSALKYLIHNPTVCKKMGQKASIEAADYDWTNIAQKYLSVYQDALDEKQLY